MCRTKLLALMFGALVLPHGSPAQPPPPHETMGVYFDAGGYLDCYGQEPYTMVTAYLLARDITAPSGISGWECSLVTDPADFMAAVTITLANGGVNASTAPDYDVTLPAAVPSAPVIRLATWTTFYLGGPIKFAIGPAHPGHFPDDPGPGYVAGDDPGSRTRLYLRCAWSQAPQPDTYNVAIFGMGCPLIKDLPPCAVPVETSTWGTIKELYR